MRSETILSIAAAVAILLFGVNPGGQDAWLWFVVPPVIVAYILLVNAESVFSSEYKYPFLAGWFLLGNIVLAVMRAGSLHEDYNGWFILDGTLAALTLSAALFADSRGRKFYRRYGNPPNKPIPGLLCALPLAIPLLLASFQSVFLAGCLYAALLLLWKPAENDNSVICIRAIATYLLLWIICGGWLHGFWRWAFFTPPETCWMVFVGTAVTALLAGVIIVFSIVFRQADKDAQFLCAFTGAMALFLCLLASRCPASDCWAVAVAGIGRLYFWALSLTSLAGFVAGLFAGGALFRRFCR